MKRLTSWLAPNFVQSNKDSKRRKADDTAAPSSSAAPKASNNYDVFLSFRGTDTRKTFVDHLYNSLDNAGIDVFRDDDELHEGEKIGNNLLQAIKNSKISIPVLSRNYASSKWCLKELVQMTECMKNDGQVVLPIFYRVEPADVQDQKGSFREAFSRLSGKYSEEEVAKWKQALHEVGSIKGWESEKTANGYEGELVKMVVKTVLSKLKETFQLVVTEQLVGIDDAVADILSLLDDNPIATQIVGIHGMGGIGKTTLAKVVYNKLSGKFQHCSFIADIRESSRHKGILCLQEQLIQDILGAEDRVSNKDEGIRIMKSRFKRMKVLILLDDVDNRYQLEALIGKHDWFERGSRIIITTRIKSILDHAEVNYPYELNEMAKDQSLILFSRHAFRRDSPPCDFKSLSHEVVTKTGGLPLALEVMGSYLCGKNPAIWRDALKRLIKVPHEEVQKKLKISYDALNYDEQQIFLDIACFFIGTDLRIASYMWDACNFYPSMGIETLSFMSLIKIGNNHELKMHDQLRDLGREIVRQEDCNTSINRSRLWNHEEASEVLQRNKGIEMLHVQALRLDRCISFRKFTTEQFEKVPNLRFLEGFGGNMTTNSKGLFPKLRWLRCQGSSTVVATSFHLEKLVILDVPHAEFSELREGWSHLKVAKDLKVLNLAHCWNLKFIPNLSTFQFLEILVLASCFRLKQIHHSIGECRGLISLDLSGCLCIQVLPKEMAKLKDLKELNISWTAIEEIPAWIGSLKKLEILHASGCYSLVRLPDSIGHLVNLSTLDLNLCLKLARIPKSIGSLVKLQRLSLGKGTEIYKWFMRSSFDSILLEKNHHYHMSIRDLPEFIGDLKNLKILDISTSELNNLPSTIGKLGNLEELDASYCESLGGEFPINGLSSLKILELRWTGISGFSDTFDKLSHLEKLNLGGCKILQSLPELPSRLMVLEVTCQHHTLPQLFHLIQLKELTIYECKLLESIPKLPSAIFKLFVYGCDELKELPNLSSLDFLSHLDIVNCRELTEIKGLEALKSLVHLSVSGSKRLSKFDGLEHAESLGYLDMSFSSVSDELIQVQGVDRLKNLEELDICRCQYLIRPDLSQLTHLKQLHANDCHNLVEIKGLERLENLEELYIKDCTSIETLPGLSCLDNLKCLNIRGCSKLRDVQGLEKGVQVFK